MARPPKAPSSAPPKTVSQKAPATSKTGRMPATSAPPVKAAPVVSAPASAPTPQGKAPPVPIEPAKPEPEFLPVAQERKPEQAQEPAPVPPKNEALVSAEPGPGPSTPEVARVAVEEMAPAVSVEALTPSQPDVEEQTVAATQISEYSQSPYALEGNFIMNEALETTKKFTEDAKVRVQSLVTEFNDKAKAAMEKSSKTFEELNDLAKGNLEAIVESSRIAAKGVEAIGQNAAEYGRVSFEKTSQTLKSFASVKSPAEFFQLQSDLVTSAFDTMASETAKTSETVLKLAGDIAQPISNRVAVVSDKLKTLAA